MRYAVRPGQVAPVYVTVIIKALVGFIKCQLSIFINFLVGNTS